MTNRAVYPRPRGGTSRRSSGNRCRPGLSPPTRGNLSRTTTTAFVSGSIPAHAGEPRFARVGVSPFAVYPRPRGGTSSRGRGRARRAGLSPPTRGNRLNVGGVFVRGRSIPAHAGEPSGFTPPPASGEVYPRPRGGTSTRPVSISRQRGLSPPTRGNPHRPAPSDRAGGSIPAHAGEPTA